MKVFEIQIDNIGSYITEEPEDFSWEFEELLLELGEKETGYSKQDLKPFLEDVKEMNINTEKTLGIITIKYFEMSKKKYYNLPEFEGW